MKFSGEHSFKKNVLFAKVKLLKRRKLIRGYVCSNFLFVFNSFISLDFEK